MKLNLSRKHILQFGLVIGGLLLAGIVWYQQRPQPQLIVAIEDQPALRFLQGALSSPDIQLIFFKGDDVGRADLVIAGPDRLYALAQNKAIQPLPEVLSKTVQELQKLQFEPSAEQLMAAPFFGYGQALLLSDADDEALESPWRNIFLDNSIMGQKPRFYTIFPSDQPSLAAQMLLALDGFQIVSVDAAHIVVNAQKDKLLSIFKEFAQAAHSSQNLAVNCQLDCFWVEWTQKNSRFALAEEWMFWALRDQSGGRQLKLHSWAPAEARWLRWAGLALPAGKQPSRAVGKLIERLRADVMQEKLVKEYGRVSLKDTQNRIWPWQQLPERAQLEGKSLQALNAVLEGNMSPQEAAGLF